MGFDPLLGSAFWLIMKYAVLAVLFLYIVFAVIVIKQVQNMTNTLKVGFEGLIKIIAFAHLIAAVAVFVISFTTL